MTVGRPAVVGRGTTGRGVRRGLPRRPLRLADPVGRERNVRGHLTPPRRITVAVAVTVHGVILRRRHGPIVDDLVHGLDLRVDVQTGRRHNHGRFRSSSRLVHAVLLGAHGSPTYLQQRLSDYGQLAVIVKSSA